MELAVLLALGTLTSNCWIGQPLASFQCGDGTAWPSPTSQYPIKMQHVHSRDDLVVICSSMFHDPDRLQMLHMTSCATWKECACFLLFLLRYVFVWILVVYFESCPTCTCICCRPTLGVKVFAKKRAVCAMRTNDSGQDSSWFSTESCRELSSNTPRKGSGCTA